MTEQHQQAELYAVQLEAQSAKMITEEQEDEFDADYLRPPVYVRSSLGSNDSTGGGTRGSYRSSQSIGASHLAQMQFMLSTPPSESESPGTLN
eukprot:scaffold74058_cov60-Attheya_sp.AAC.5